MAGTLVEGEAFSLGFVGVLVLDIFIALAAGYLLGLIFSGFLATNLPDVAKIGLLLLSGLLVFEAGYRVPEWSAAILPFKIKIEPLLISMMAGFTMTNFTRYRHEFEHLLSDISPYVYVAFFALTGVALKLDVLVATIGIAAVLFAVRVFSIFVGTFAGGTLAGEPVQFRRWAWMGLITQAGIALGLAREAAAAFPDTLGNEFATLLISVVVLNEIFGPLLLKIVLRRVGEAHERGSSEGDTVRDVLILGIEPQSIALARQLVQQNWKVILADTDPSHVQHVEHEKVIDECRIEQIDINDLSSVLSENIDALVAMLPDDRENLQACETAYEQFGLQNMVVRLQNMNLHEEFEELGVRVVDPGSAIVTPA